MSTLRVLAATSLTPGSLPGDFHYAADGEVVTSGSYAMCDSHTISDGGLSTCGCDRAFKSVTTGKATTTCTVADVEQTREELVQQLTARLLEAWGADAGDPEIAEIAEAEVDDMLAVAQAFPAGAVLGQNIETLYARA